jgi:hypothetical protein
LRISTSAVSACSKAAATATRAALSSSSSLSGSTTSMTPLMAINPSTLGATASILPASSPAIFRIEFSTSSLTRTVDIALARFTVRFA